MKRVLLIALFMGAVCVKAQNSENDNRIIPKGTWNIGGNFSLGITNLDTNNNNLGIESDRLSFSLFPTFGYTFDDNWIVGLKTGYGYSRVENGSSGNSEVKSESFSLAPYVRKYFGVSNNLLLYFQGELGYTGIWTKDLGGIFEQTDFNTDQFIAAFRPGVTFFVSERLAFESSIGALQYSSSKTESGALENKSKVFGLNFNSSNLLFGLSYYF